MGYEVKKGDGWYKIAKTLGVNVNDLLKANNAILDTMLQPGQKLQTSTKLAAKPTSGWKNSAANDWANEQINKNAELVSKAKTNVEKDNQARKDKIYQGQPDKTYQEMQSKDKIQALQRQLRAAGYDIGKFGADGVMGNATNAAIKQAEQDGYTVTNNQLVKKQPVKQVTSQQTPQVFGAAGPEYAVMAQAQMYKDNPEMLNTGFEELQRQVTPRQYTAAQNTVVDLIKAPIKRVLGSTLGNNTAEFIMPKTVYNENHLSDELYTWLQDAVDKKWSPEERIKYFENNPNAKITKGWTGRLTGKKATQSDYQKYYGTPYTGPMKYGFKETMFGDGLPQAQGTLGSFDIVYTKDGAYIEDDWDFGTGKEFDTNSLMGFIRSSAEKFGSQENDSLESIRGLKALIKYKQ